MPVQCICRQCGAVFSIPASHLAQKRPRRAIYCSQACRNADPHRPRRPQEGANTVDRTGQRYGQLTVVERAGSLNNDAAWRCRCDCGTERVVRAGSLRHGTKSCGCSRSGKGKPRPIYRSAWPPGRSARNRVLKQYRVSARSRGVAWEVTEADFDALVTADCAYCGVAPSTVSKPSRNGSFTYNGIDRVDNRLGYVAGNVVSCCSICNHAKHVMTQAAFLAWINRLVAHATAERALTTPPTVRRRR